MPCASRFGARCGPVRSLLSKQPNVNKNSRSTSEFATPRNATPVPGLRPEPVAPFGAAVVARVGGFYGSGMADGFSERYRDLLTGSYDCVDRIVLNAYFPLGHNPGGFRVWWRRLSGSDEHLDNNHLMRMAGRFARRVRAFGKAYDVPVIDCVRSERKHRIA